MRYPRCIAVKYPGDNNVAVHWTSSHTDISQILGLLDLEAEVDMLDRLVNDARAENIDFCMSSSASFHPRISSPTPTINSPLMQIRLRDVPATFKQELALPCPLLLEPCGDVLELIALDVV